MSLSQATKCNCLFGNISFADFKHGHQAGDMRGTDKLQCCTKKEQKGLSWDKISSLFMYLLQYLRISPFYDTIHNLIANYVSF